jgi:alpha-N-arabinofuranosidase
LPVKHAYFALDPAFGVGAVERRLFGSFVEHMGRSVYTGIYEPGHPAADESGLRRDVLGLARELGVSVVRYPGGNFVSNYHWEDGVGPRDSRPTRLDLAWRQIERNAFGLDEFMTWVRELGAEPMMAVNLGTRGLREACDLLEYANHPGGTHLSDLRGKNGAPEPYDIRLWCLGNEMDGPWQIGGKTAAEYGRLAAETAKAMRRVDPRVELIACGSSDRDMPTFGSWEATVLEHCYEHVDYISLHAYYDPAEQDRASFLASAVDMDDFISAVVATADHVGAKLGRRKKLKLSFDEWNVWSRSRFGGEDSLDWTEAPRLIEEDYDVTGAVVVGSLLISLLGHVDRVGIACQAQLANVIAPIRTEPGGPAWRQTIFHPFALTAAHARGRVLRVEPVAPRQETARYGDVPVLAATATYDAETGDVAIFAVNRDLAEPLALDVDLRGVPGLAVAEHVAIAEDDNTARNTQTAPDRVVPRRLDGARIDGDRLTAVLPPVSFNVVRLRKETPR